MMDNIEDVRVVQYYRNYALRGIDGFMSWFKPVNHRYMSRYALEIKRDGVWSEVEVVSRDEEHEP